MAVNTTVQRTDVLIIGAGLAGLVAATEAVHAGCTVTIVDQESRANLGGQAHWSFGGLFLVDSPEQRRLGIRDSVDFALADWRATAGFDRIAGSTPGGTDGEDYWASRWAEAYVHFAAGEKRSYLRDKGHRIFPMVGWAERGGHDAGGPGNGVPRFHITWGTGPGIVEVFADALLDNAAVTWCFRHRVTELLREGDRVTGARGSILADCDLPRGQQSSREVVGEFSLNAGAVVVAGGGIGGNHDLVRHHWPARLGRPPRTMLTGVPAYVDGSLLGIAKAAGARLVNQDRMWHYVEGITNWDPVWPGHGIRILPGPTSLWLDATGRRLPAPYFPGFDTLGTLGYMRETGYDYSWFLTTEKVIEKEFQLSGSEQNPDLTERKIRLLAQRIRSGAPEPVQNFLEHGVDFLSARTPTRLAELMNELTGDGLIDPADLASTIIDRDRAIINKYSKDLQVSALRGARKYIGERYTRIATPHRFLDDAAGSLVAVRLHVLTRKTLGGIQTDVQSRVLGDDGRPVEGLYAAGEVAGFGGGGVHGYRSLEGTFLGGCIFSGRAAGRAAGDAARG